MKTGESGALGSLAGFAVLSFVLALLLGIGALVYWGLGIDSGESHYATLVIPDEAVVHLPAGTADLTFTMDLSNTMVAIPILTMQFTPIGGGAPAPVSAHIGSPDSDNGVTHVRVGTVDVPRAGRYRVEVDGDINGSPNPELHIGVVKSRADELIGGLVLTGLLLVSGVVSTIVAYRRNARARG